MTADPAVLDRIIDRLLHTLSAGGPDQLRSPFTVQEIVQSLVPYRTYRNEMGVDTLQEYEQAILEMLAGARGWLVCDPDTVSVIQKELSSPDPDTGLLRRLHTVEVRMGAIRMPVRAELKQPIARESEDGHAGSQRVMSDAVAIGAVMDREDAERAGSGTADTVASGPAGAESRAASVPAAALAPASVLASAQAPASAQTAAPVSASVSASVPAPLYASVPAPANSIAVADDALSVTAKKPARRTPRSSPVIAAPIDVSVPAVTAIRSTPVAPAAAVPSVFGDPMDFRGVRHAPVDIGGVIFLFGMVAREIGFHVEAMSSGFPRCEAKRQLAPGKWVRLRIDFELESRQFRDAGRNPGACDLIVCWKDTWPDRPATLDVLALDSLLHTLSARE
jgi:hypothetical protein